MPFSAHSQIRRYLALSIIYERCRPFCDESTILSYVGVVNHLLRGNATDVVNAKTVDEVRIFERDLLTPSYFFHNLWNVTVQCDCVYNKQALSEFFVKNIDPSISKHLVVSRQTMVK